MGMSEKEGRRVKESFYKVEKYKDNFYVFIC
jgi:hypothetical protein